MYVCTLLQCIKGLLISVFLFFVFQTLGEPECENGYCNDGRCVCIEGFNGTTCNIRKILYYTSLIHTYTRTYNYVLLNVPQSLNTAPGPACNGSYCWNNGTCDSDTDTCICTERFTGPECRREICEFML